MPSNPLQSISLNDLARQTNGLTTVARPSPMLPPAVKCHSCGAVNRLSSQQRKGTPRCGRCKKPLRRLRSGACVLLCDVSSSMSWRAETQTRIEVVNEALRSARIALKHEQPRVLAFNDHTREIGQDEPLPKPSGGTGLTEAFGFKGLGNARSLVLLSDGCPNEPAKALAAGLRLAMPIDVVFCGDPGDTQAIEFMRDLARRTGGKFSLEPVVQPEAAKKIAQSVAGLLAAPTPAKRLQ